MSDQTLPFVFPDAPTSKDRGSATLSALVSGASIMGIVRTVALPLVLAFFGCSDPGSGPTPPEVQPPGSTSNVPDELLALDAAEPTMRIFVSADEACGDSSLNDGSVESCDGLAGPFASWDELAAAAPSVSAGTAIVFREGRYTITNIGMSTAGSPEAPIQLLGYPGETAILDGGLDSTGSNFVDRVSVLASAQNLVVKGLRFENCHRTCLLITGQNVLAADNVFVGGQEDSLKTSPPNSDVWITRNHFSMPAGTGINPEGAPEAIDGFQSTRVWVTENEFTDSDVSTGGWGTIVWFKGGSSEVTFANNHIHNVRVEAAASIMGGCCFNNWDWQPNRPVASSVFFEDNLYEHIEFNSNYSYRGTIMAQGCHGCTARNNRLTNCGTGLSVRSTESGGEAVGDLLLTSTNVVFENNEVDVTGDGYLASVEAEVGLAMRGQTYTCSEAKFRYEDEDIDSSEWLGLGFDEDSSLCP